MPPIVLDHSTRKFVDQVENLSHSHLSRCWHCRTCSGGCPFSEDMDYMPNAIIRMIQFGLKEKALSCSSIWLCVGCNTCAMECPNGVDVAAVMDALRQMAIQEKIRVAEPGILSFHNAVIDSIARYGRTHKLEIMMRYKLAGKDLFSDIDLGFRMMIRRKLDLLPSKVKDRKSIRNIFNRNQTGR